VVNFTMLVRNRPRLTEQALNSLASGRPWRPEELQGMKVTILDDRSDAETRDILESWCLVRRAHLIGNEVKSGTGPLRNKVIDYSEIQHGRGDYLYLSDNDVFFKPGWLEELIWAEEEAWGRGFRVIGAYNHPFHQPVSSIEVSGLHKVNEVNALATQSMLMRWEVWDKYGPFCQTPVDKVCQSEDVDFCNRITKDGYKVGVVSPNLVVSTGITNTFGEKIPGYELVKAQCPQGVICE